MSVSLLHGICMLCHFLDTVNPLLVCLYDLPTALQLLRPRTMKTRAAETELDLEQMSAGAKSHKNKYLCRFGSLNLVPIFKTLHL